MSEPLHVAIREEARFSEDQYRAMGDSELADRELKIIALCNTVDDLVTLVNRMCRRIQKVSPNDDVVAQAVDYIKRKNLQGSPLREGGQ